VSAGDQLRVVPGRSAGREERGELCVILSCHELVCALPASWIERLVLPKEVSVIVGERPSAAAGKRAWELVLVGEQRYAACNLGTQLGLRPLDAAWALLRAPHRGAVLPIALQTGPCLVVQPLGTGVPLPPAAFRTRSGAVAAAFPTALVKSKLALSDVGLRLDPSRLWTESELDAAAAVLGGESETGE